MIIQIPRQRLRNRIAPQFRRQVVDDLVDHGRNAVALRRRLRLRLRFYFTDKKERIERVHPASTSRRGTASSAILPFTDPCSPRSNSIQPSLKPSSI
jgi:hypothetical protein